MKNNNQEKENHSVNPVGNASECTSISNPDIIKMKQVIDRGYVKYIDEDGWEDGEIIEIIQTPSKFKRNNSKSIQFYTRNRMVQVVVEKEIGVKIFLNASSDMKRLLINNALKDFRQWKISRYGSVYNYDKATALKKGFKSYWEFRKHIIINKRGFKSMVDYRNFLAKKRGFKNNNDRLNYWSKIRNKKIIEQKKI